MENQVPIPESPGEQVKSVSPEERRLQSRRNWMKGGLAALGLGVAAAADNALRTPEGNIVTIEDDQATYRIQYTNHLFQIPHEIVSTSDCVLLETQDIDFHDHAGREHDVNAELFEWEMGVLRAASSLRKPVFLGSTSTNVKKRHLAGEFGLNMLLAIAEMYVGSKLVFPSQKKSGATEKPKPSTIAGHTRRGLLMIAGTYLMLPLSQTIGTVASANFGVSSTDEGTVSRQAVRHLAAFNSRAHPEIWATKLVQGRSTLLAQNAKAIAALLPRPQGRKPTVGICVGAAHFDIETELLRSLPARMERLASFWGRDTLFHERFILRIDPSPSPRNPGELSCRFTLLEDPAFPKE